MNGVTSTGQTVLISAGVTLAVGLLSLLGALLVESLRRRSTDRRWLLDRRHEVYVEFLRVATELQTALTWTSTDEEGDAYRQGKAAELQDAWFRVTLVASTEVTEVAHGVHVALMQQPFQGLEARRHLRVQAVDLLGRLSHVMRMEIQPKAPQHASGSAPFDLKGMGP